MLTGDEYMALLLERQAEVWNGSAPPPLLEWFIRAGDELIFTPPTVAPQPKRETKPRTYRTAASLRAERDRLLAQRRPLLEPLASDPAATHGAALGRKRTNRLAQREDGRLRRYVALGVRISTLNDRIASAQRREDTAHAEQAAS